MDILKEKIDANSFQTMKHIIFLTSTKNDKIRYFEKEEADKRFLPRKDRGYCSNPQGTGICPCNYV